MKIAIWCLLFILIMIIAGYLGFHMFGDDIDLTRGRFFLKHWVAEISIIILGAMMSFARIWIKNEY